MDQTSSKIYKNLPVYLDHFYTKSTEEYIKRKFMKTSAMFGDVKIFRNHSLKYLKDWYFKYNKVTKEKQRMFNALKRKNKIQHI